jgi:hypothetical protein
MCHHSQTTSGSAAPPSEWYANVVAGLAVLREASQIQEDEDEVVARVLESSAAGVDSTILLEMLHQLSVEDELHVESADLDERVLPARTHLRMSEQVKKPLTMDLSNKFAKETT